MKAWYFYCNIYARCKEMQNIIVASVNKDEGHKKNILSAYLSHYYIK